jgi:hypothetical protein
VCYHLVSPRRFRHYQPIQRQVGLSTLKTGKSKGGRPRTDATPVTVRILPEMLEWLDAERAKLDPVPSRPEMIRQMMASMMVKEL